MFYRQEFGIDPGTDTIKIYDKKEDTITAEKNLIAVRGHAQVLAAGNAAGAMWNRSAADTVLSTPVQGGRISDIWHAEAVIHSLLFSQKHYLGRNPALYFAVPTDMTEIEKRAYASIARRGRLRNCTVYLVEKPLADALALGIPLSRAKGSMMINMGAFSTELSAVADGHVILNGSVPAGGNLFDENIVTAIRRRNRLRISARQAEALKIRFLDAEGEPEEAILTEGIDADTGLPRNGFVTSKTVEKAVAEGMEQIAGGLTRFLERIPPQVRRTVAGEGIHLLGGSSHIRGVPAMLSERLGYPVLLSSLYGNGTINGLKEVINHSDANHFAYIPMDDKKKKR